MPARPTAGADLQPGEIVVWWRGHRADEDVDDADRSTRRRFVVAADWEASKAIAIALLGRCGIGERQARSTLSRAAVPLAEPGRSIAFQLRGGQAAGVVRGWRLDAEELSVEPLLLTLAGDLRDGIIFPTRAAAEAFRQRVEQSSGRTGLPWLAYYGELAGAGARGAADAAPQLLAAITAARARRQSPPLR